MKKEIKTKIKAIKDELVLKWEKTQLLQSCQTPNQKETLSILLENQFVFNQQWQFEKKLDIHELDFEGVKRVTIPLIVRIFKKLTTSNLVGFQAASMSTIPLIHRDNYGNLKTIESSAKTRFLKSVWKNDFQEDVTDLIEFSSSVANEFNDEILTDLSNNCGKTSYHDWSRIDALVDTILMTSSSIERGMGRPANWIVVPPEIHEEFLKTKHYFQPNPQFNDDFNQVGAEPVEIKDRLFKAGILQKKWTVYVNPNVQDLEILLGYKGDEFTTGYFYIPYLMFSGISEVEGKKDFPMFTRYGKQLVNKDYYSKIIISGYSAKREGN